MGIAAPPGDTLGPTVKVIAIRSERFSPGMVTNRLARAPLASAGARIRPPETLGVVEGEDRTPGGWRLRRLSERRGERSHVTWASDSLSAGGTPDWTTGSAPLGSKA